MIKIGMLIADRYEVLEKVGTGGMSDVYKAKDHRLNRMVAVKVLKQEFSENATFVSKFRVEAQAAAGLMHPNIVNVYDVGEEKGAYYIIMELVNGITLKRYIEKKERLVPREAVTVAIQVSMGLAAAHRNHIIHRDIKPQNIIISKEGKVKVTDFGIAKASTSNTITSNVMGSVHYTSPEQARGGYSDEKSDIYSLGITMYEMLTGRVPFDGETNVAVALMHIQGKMTPPRELEPSIPKSFEKVILKCTQKKPEWRYSSARELIADLRKVLTHPDGEYVIIPGMEDAAGSTITVSDADLAKLNAADAGQPSGRRQEEPEAAPAEKASFRKLEDLSDSEPVKGKDVEEAADEEDEEVDSHMGKILMTMGIIGFVILIIVLIILGTYITGLAGSGFSLFGKHAKETGSETVLTTQEQTKASASETKPTETTEETQEKVTVPNLLGKTEADAVKLLKKKNLEYETKDGTSDKYDAGEVCEQSVEAGTSVSEHTTVILTICKGTDAFELDNVAGIGYDTAVSMLQAQGLKTKIKFISDNTVGVDEVVYTDPKAGSSVVEGDTITLYVHKDSASESVTVPNVIGKDLDDAVAEIESAGLTYNGKSSDYSDSYAEGKVMNQSLTSGKSVTKGEAMSITVSLGAKKQSSYSASISVPSPFDSSSETEGELKIEVSQGSETRTLFDDTVDADSLPSSLSDKSSSDEDGTVTAYFNGEKYDSFTVSYK